MFAGLNTLRPKVIASKNLDSFEFSTAYLQFWDKMEKSNLFLEQMIELRDRTFTDREWQLLVEWAEGDGGWWNYVTALIEKYGVVPKDVMPETYASEHTGTMNRVLKMRLCAEAVQIRNAAAQGMATEDLREMKKAALSDIYRFLAINLGTPPSSFEWRYEPSSKDKDENTDAVSNASEEENPDNEESVDSGDAGMKECPSEPSSETEKSNATELTPFESYTPLSFYRDFVGVSLEEYVCLYNDPTNEFHRHFLFRRSTNMAGAPEMDFVNLPASQLKQAAMEAVLQNEPVWFAADVGVDHYGDLGILADDVYDYESIFGMDLSLSKADRIRFGLGASNHAMVFTGVDILNGEPRKWLVENSWGTEKGDQGCWTLYDSWFDENVYVVIVPKTFVSKEILAIFSEPAIELPPWYPGAVGL
jgi:bleomycin hydrolase